MPTIYSFHRRNSRTYRFFNCILTQRWQKITFAILVMLIVIQISAFSAFYIYYIRIKNRGFNQDQNIEMAMNSGLMIDCEFVVTPWFLNLCHNEDNGNAFAWRQFKLLKTDNPDCSDVHERIPCYDYSLPIKPNRTKVFPRACPLTAMRAFGKAHFLKQFSWMKNISNLSEASVVVTMPLIADLKPFLKQTLRASDIFMVCPSCIFNGCDQNSKRLIENYRHGWPFQFSGCLTRFSNSMLCSNVTMNDDDYSEYE